MKLLLLDRPEDKQIISKRKVEFFGPWAQPINSPEDLVKPAFEPYPTPESVYSASSRAMNVASDILESLAEILPDLTKVNKGKRFWRVFLGYYVIVLVGIVEDVKNRHLSLPEKDYILGLTSKDYLKDYNPYLWKDVEEFLFHDDYFKWHTMALYLKNHYRNHESIEYLKIPQRKVVKRSYELYKRILEGGYKRLFKKARSILLDYVGLLNKEKVLYDNTCSLVWDQYHLEDFDFRNLKAAILPEGFLPDIKAIPPFQVDKEKRERIKNYLPHPYGEIISLSLPIVALEGLPYLVSLIDNDKLQKFEQIKRIYTNGQAFLNEVMKRILLALLADDGKKIISIQHGGGATYLAHSVMFLERIVADEYISWGPGYNYIESPNMKNARALPSIYLSNLKQTHSKRKKWKILFVVLEENRYIKWLYSPLFPDMVYNYFKRQKVLFDHFFIGKSTAVKIYGTTYGWRQANWIKSIYSKAKLLTTGKFVNYALQSKIVIVDYNSTAFLEMLAMRHPFLATWNRRWFRGGRLFEAYIDRLIDIGIFYEQPESLIRSYDEIISLDIKKWWNESRRQNILKEMSNNFALTSDTVYEEWTKEFERGNNSENKRTLHTI